MASAAFRISFTFAAAFALAMMMLGVAVYIAADAQFRNQRDRDITEEVEELSRQPNRARVIAEIALRERETASQPFAYALFDPRTGTQVGGSFRIAMPPPGFDWVAFNDPGEGPDLARSDTIDLAYGDRLTIGVDSETIEAIDATIFELFGAAFVAVLGISLGGGYLLARFLRRRLALISGTARAIVAGDLSPRVPVGGRDDEFAAAGRAVNAMLDRIAQLMENLRQVSSDLAHDLRTPLLRLRGQLDRLPDDPAAAARASEEVEKLLALFAAILRINEVEGGALASGFVPVDLSAVVADLGESYELALAEEGRTLSISVEPGIRVLGHAELLAQAIANLLDNCRIHTPEGTHIRMAISATGPSAILEVRDDGPGIPETNLPRMLHRFVRGEQSRTTPGSGLGLSLVEAVVKAHQGTIDLTNGAPGLIVRLTFPRAGGPETAQ